MARLNDPPQPSIESIDALKRRFVRQNREIARANSNQSLRIRNLESEVSRLLSENVSLREQIIKLHYELEKSASRSTLDSVNDVKIKLETKLAELGNLVYELGAVQKTGENSRPQKRKSMTRSSPKRSPDQRNWRNTLTLSEATGGADGRLPPIVEDKCFPRRTLDAEEIFATFADPVNIADSPDLGPPPVAHLDEGDPIKFDPDHQALTTEKMPDVVQTMQSVLPANLETRKKRRESSHHREPSVKEISIEVLARSRSKNENPTPIQSLKSGAKRKFAVREEEDQQCGGPESDGLRFESKSTDSQANEINVTRPDAARGSVRVPDRIGSSAANRKDNPKDVVTSVRSNGRKALGPKSVNTDPQSPVKVNKDSRKDKLEDRKDDVVKRIRGRVRGKEEQSPPANGASRPKIGEATHTTKQPAKTAVLPPETPAAQPLDLFSPSISEPSAARPELRDTPPPPDLGPDTGTGSFGRGSRRPKGSVSYAEPNLRDKMRRPTKDLIDAVGAEERLYQANLDKVEDTATKQMEVIFKQEEGADTLPNWMTKPVQETQSQQQRQRAETTSPLSKKAHLMAVELPVSVTTDRRRRTLAPYGHGKDTESSKASSGAGFAIAALAAGSQKSKSWEHNGPKEDVIIESQEHEGLEQPNVFDFAGSSPVDDGGKNVGNEKQEDATTMRSSRRHSSVPASSDGKKGSISISRRSERRRETMLRPGLGAEQRKDEQEQREVKDVKSVAGLETGLEQLSLSRGERAANRRRSMML